MLLLAHSVLYNNKNMKHPLSHPRLSLFDFLKNKRKEKKKARNEVRLWADVFCWLSSGRQSVARPEMGRAGCQQENTSGNFSPRIYMKMGSSGLALGLGVSYLCFTENAGGFWYIANLCGFDDFPNLLEFTISGGFPRPADDSEMKVGLSSRQHTWL